MTMTQPELDVLHKRLSASKSYLEYGAGASTITAAQSSNLSRIDCVESSAQFIDERVRPDPAVQTAVAAGRLRFHIIDIGPTGDWGAPVDDRARHLWPNYSLSVFSQPGDHDLVLVDGRFRVACTLAAILCTPPNAVIMIHDFFWFRVEYRAVLPFLNVIERADTLAVFAKRADVDRRRVQRSLAEFQYEPDDAPSRLRLSNALRRRLRRAAP